MKPKFKTSHLKKFDFSSPEIQREFKELREENKKIFDSRKPDLSKLKNIFFNI